jgi:DNA-binding PadR family transcriptional regulator
MLPGTLDMLVLSTLTTQSMHGYGIAQHIRRLSLDMLKVEEGSLYPALQRMRQKGWIKSSGSRRRTTSGPATTPSRRWAAGSWAARNQDSRSSWPRSGG